MVKPKVGILKEHVYSGGNKMVSDAGMIGDKMRKGQQRMR